MRRQFDFIKWAKVWLAISLVVIAVGLVSLATRGINLSVDYTGGTELELQFGQELTVTQVREAVAELSGKSPAVKKVGGGEVGTDFIVTTPRLTDQERLDLVAKLKERLGTEVTVLSVDDVSGTIRSELIRNAVLAVLIATAFQLIYIGFRFEFRSGVTAILAVVHDVLVTLGMVSLLGLEVGPAFVAAVLTIIGYSVNDTIIIFDRIRENLQRQKGRGESLADLVNRSLSETVTRSLYTSVTVLLVLAAILWLGGETTRDFAATLFIGTVAGAYSSICFAAPIWYWWRQAGEGKRSRAARAR
ncbi:MAG: protein translocase subunit SecF [Firmicutes bacterium]|nr:protein translocase subunit SecF [Bacillota bacterium]